MGYGVRGQVVGERPPHACPSERGHRTDGLDDRGEDVDEGRRGSVDRAVTEYCFDRVHCHGTDADTADQADPQVLRFEGEADLVLEEQRCRQFGQCGQERVRDERTGNVRLAATGPGELQPKPVRHRADVGRAFADVHHAVDRDGEYADPTERSRGETIGCIADQRRPRSMPGASPAF